MSINVEYLTKAEIEREANILFVEAQLLLRHPAVPPIRVDEILEKQLGYSLDFDDLQRRLNLPDVLGALYLDTQQVFIDESLVPEDNPEHEGRYNFTVAHEIGHIQLHAAQILANEVQADLLRTARHLESDELGELVERAKRASKGG